MNQHRRLLCLMRHAEAAAPHGPAILSNDHSRVLTAHGITQSQQVGEKLTALNIKPDQALCSTATRTKQTLDKLQAGGGFSISSILYNDHLYSGMVAQLIQAIENVTPDVYSLILVAHNPAIYELAALLAGDAADSTHALIHGYPPATVTVISFDSDWHDITKSKDTIQRRVEAVIYTK